MRISRITIRTWRNLRGVDIRVPDESSVVCLVGENGSGKSTVLEVLAYASHHLGLSSGTDIPRGVPQGALHDLEVEAQLPESVLEQVKNQLSHVPLADWTGSLTFSSRSGTGDAALEQVDASGIDDPQIARAVGQASVSMLRSRTATHYLYLDADRSYPPVVIQPHQLGEIWSNDWESPEWTKQWAYRSTRTLYEEWNKYFIGTEEKIALEYVAKVREAELAGVAHPDFRDPFEGYRESVAAVLPHLQFSGVETQGASRTIVFDSSGLKIKFSQLSGGEREIAFLIGQIERFGLRSGLLMIDEPELHLNPDLLRTWIAFLRDTVDEGQIWTATHSLEAVEVAGPESTFVFERDSSDRLTRSVTCLAGRPTMSALSAAIGAPAFAISRLRFVLVEGDRQSRERERFYDLCGDPDVNPFMEGGSCREVVRRLTDLRDLAHETNEQLKVGGVVDRDFRSDEEIEELVAEHDIHVLGCHEVENLFLHPEAISVLIARGSSGLNAVDVIQSSSDRFAGLWVAQRADASLPDLSGTPKGSISALASVDWNELSAATDELVAQSSSHFENPSERTQWGNALLEAISEYESLRTSPELWIHCLGKQVASRIASDLGFNGTSYLQTHVATIWRDGEALEPPALVDLRTYIGNISAS